HHRAYVLARPQPYRRTILLDGRLRHLVITDCRHRAEAAADHRIKRISAARRCPIEAPDLGPIAGLDKMLRDQAEMTGVIEQTPAPDGAGRDAALRESHDQRCSRFQHPPGFADDFARACQMLDRNTDRRTVELAGSKWQPGILI